MSIITAGRFLLFLISNLGYWEFFRRKSGMNIFFLPAFTVSFYTTILFFGGIFNFKNCLLFASIIMFFIGIALSFYYSVKDWGG